MAPRTRSAGRLADGPVTLQHNLDTQVVHAIDANNRGFPALANEIYLEIMSHLPSVPIPTPFHSPSHPEIRRSRHEMLLSLSQTCRSLRKIFWRYLWQRIEVREGMKIGGENDTLKNPLLFYRRRGDEKSLHKYAVELVRQLEVVTVRNPQLAQHVNYLDVFIGEYSCDTVLAELARCLSLFSNLHTIQIDVTLGSRRSLGKVFERTFKEYSYPQIHNVSVMSLSKSFLASCPEARRVGLMGYWFGSSLRTILGSCPRLEVLEDFSDVITRDDDACEFVVENFPNLRHVTISPSIHVSNSVTLPMRGNINVLAKLNQLQTITVFFEPFPLTLNRDHWHEDEQLKRDWLDKAETVLITLRLRDKLEKFLTIVTVDSNVHNQVTQTITLKRLEGLREVL